MSSFVDVKRGTIAPHIVIPAGRMIPVRQELHGIVTMLGLQLQNVLVVLPFFALAQAALPLTGNFRIFSTNSTGGHNVFDVTGSNTDPPALGSTTIIAQPANPVAANGLNQQIATQASLNGVNLYSFISLEKFNPIGQVYFTVPNPGAGVGAVVNGHPTFFTLNEIIPRVYTIVVANTNLALTATNAPTNQIVVQLLNATNTLQHWQFTPVA
ncbi:hypothetical protein EXIGLDRAFT_776908 [Exidia glandulosa HHB12029]|uniref:Ricin B lectin domain-containing protein n=1 Tax=Exidia glandulosa HHB12029 TaxID=1314781 RepID=A0A165DAA4_EXIGL|nr:hypothetical protein EXIGLDRAFT_776908 [Exidia glandulosa HHB12029]